MKIWQGYVSKMDSLGNVSLSNVLEVTEEDSAYVNILLEVFNSEDLYPMYMNVSDIYLVDDKAVSAFVMAKDQDSVILLGTWFIEQFSVDELRSIMLHEFHHILSIRDWRPFKREYYRQANLTILISGFLAWVGIILGFMFLWATAIAVWFLSCIYSYGIQWSNHREEFNADRYAAEIYGPEHVESVLSKMSMYDPRHTRSSPTHPSITSRLKKVKKLRKRGLQPE